MKDKKAIGLMSIILVVLIAFFVACGTLFYLVYKQVMVSQENNYYVATKVLVDKEELSKSKVKKEFNVEGIQEVLSVYIKDTGDCGILYMGEGSVGTWKKNKETFKINTATEKIKLEQNIDMLIFERKLNGASVKVELEQAKKTPKWFKDNPQYTYGIKYRKKDTTNISNFMLGGQYVREKEKLYGKSFDLSKTFGNSYLGSFAIEGKNKDVLLKDGQARYLTVNDKYLYFKWIPSDGSVESICRMNKDGGKVKTLREGVCDYVQVRFGKIYFTNDAHKFCSMKLSGKKETVIIDKTVYMPYVIDDGWVIYQDDNDGEKLHLATLQGTYDQTITDKRSYCWIIKGRTLYYTGVKAKEDEANHKCVLYKMHIGNIEELKTPEEKGEKNLGDIFAINSKSIYGGNAEGVPLKEWKSLTNNLHEGGYYESNLMYLDNDYEVVGKLNKQFVFCDLNTINLKTEKTTNLLSEE